MGLTSGFALIAAVQLSLPQGTVPDVIRRDATLPTSAQSFSPPPQLASTPWTLRFGPQRPDLVRYNRVEALSLGVRAQVRPNTTLGPLTINGTARFGAADRHVNGLLEVVHESLDRRIVVSGYHELAAIDERARHFGVANSLMALLVGQDDGDYYRRSGAMAEWTPPTYKPRSFRLRTFAEYQQRVEKETDVHLERLWNDEAYFRPNIAADDGWEYGGSLELGWRWGTDPGRTRGGSDALVQAATGDAEYVRTSLGLEVQVVMPARLRLSLETEGGTSWGSPSVQRLWYLGGPLTLRGYAPRVAGGQSFGRARAELDRSFSFGRLVLFSDVGWAGDRSDVNLDDALSSAGVGLAVIDGILRIDGAWPLASPHRFRLDVYLDQLL
jgi:hypothetical protein